MATTFKILDKVILTGSQNSIEFTGLGSYSSSYTDLCFMISARSNRGTYYDGLYARLNGSTSNQSNQALYSNGSTITAQNPASIQVGIIVGDTATSNTFCNGYFYIPNFSSSNYKSMTSDLVGENNATNAFAALEANLWSSTAAITSVSFSTESVYDLVSGTSIYLYGISNS